MNQARVDELGAIHNEMKDTALVRGMDTKEVALLEIIRQLREINAKMSLQMAGSAPRWSGGPGGDLEEA